MHVCVCMWQRAAEPMMKSPYHCQYLSMPKTYYGGTDLHLDRVHSP